MTDPNPLAVYGDGSDNASWSKETPQGFVKMVITNPDASAAFVADQDYFLDFTPVPTEVAPENVASTDASNIVVTGVDGNALGVMQAPGAPAPAAPETPAPTPSPSPPRPRPPEPTPGAARAPRGSSPDRREHVQEEIFSLPNYDQMLAGPKAPGPVITMALVDGCLKIYADGVPAPDHPYQQALDAQRHEADRVMIRAASPGHPDPCVAR